MIELAFGHDEEVAEWARQRMPGAARFKESKTLALVEDRRLIAAAIFHNFFEHEHGNDVEISFASTTPRWCNRRVLRAIFAIPFLQYGCVRITTITSRANSAALSLDKRLGFKLEGLVRRGWDGRTDAVVLGMLREECRWLEVRHGQEEQLAAARS